MSFISAEGKDAKNAYQPHDAFFVRSMSDLRVAKEVLEENLPDHLLAILDLNTLSLCKDKLVNVKLKSKFTDMLYRVKLKDSEQEAFIAVLVEHQSTPQKHMPLRALYYQSEIMLQCWEKEGVVPLIYTLVYYNGQEKWLHSRDVRDLIHAPMHLIDQYALKPFQLVQLNDIPDETLRKRRWAGVMAMVMKHIFDRDILPILRSLIGVLQHLERKRGGSAFVSSVLYYIVERGSTSDKDEFQSLVAEKLSPESGGKVMSILDELREAQDSLQKREEQTARHIAQNLLQRGMSPDFVAETTGLDPCMLETMANAN